MTTEWELGVDRGAIEQVRTNMDALRGKLFSLVEAVGLPARQERAFKSCIRTTTYDAQADLEAILRGGEDQ